MIELSDIGDHIRSIFIEAGYEFDECNSKQWIKPDTSAIIEAHWYWEPNSDTQITVRKNCLQISDGKLIIEEIEHPVTWHTSELSILKLELADPTCFDTLRAFIAGSLTPDSISCKRGGQRLAISAGSVELL